MAAVKSVSSELGRAVNIARSLGTYTAARYMQKRGWSLEAALWVLVRATIK